MLASHRFKNDKILPIIIDFTNYFRIVGPLRGLPLATTKWVGPQDVFGWLDLLESTASLLRQ